jgi:hypothetical protein
MSAANVLVVVPTTGGPLVVRSLKVRPGLPASAAFASGDYRPLPWSGDYARLSAAGGPLSALAGPGPHELRLSGSFDAGRSWEAPVCLAHGLLARGHRLVAEPAEADLVLWATGAVDLDLAVLPADYALLDKLERSRALLDEARHARLAVLLPEGPERAEAGRALGSLGRAHPPIPLPAGSVPAALAALCRALEGTEAPPAPRVGRSRRVALAGAAGAGLAALGLGALVLARAPSAGTPDPGSAAPGPTVSTSAPPAPPVAPPRPPAAIVVEELTAPARSTCRRVAFGADAPERRPVPEEGDGRLRPSRLEPALCGLAFRSAVPGGRIEVGPELRAASLPPSPLADGAQAYFLREGGRQNLVYAVQAVPAAGSDPAAASRLSHALAR